jgi:LacI family transcriptional regulator
MADVAQVAGVSAMTVSRVVNGKGEVSPATRERVLEVVERLGYRPSGIARSLASQRTRTLGLVVPDVSNPFFATLAQGVEHVAYANGYNVFLCNTNEDPQRELAVLESLEEKQVDGLLLCSSRLDEDQLASVVARHSSVVLVNRVLAGNSHPSLLVDDEAGGRLATHHLLERGRRALGFLAGPKVSHSGQERLKGFRSALEAGGVPFEPSRTQSCVPSARGGRQATLRLLTEHPDLDALFCYNDLVAVGALQACAERGRHVPGDVAVVGYDDILLAALVTPSLTTCRVPRYELGSQAAKLLLAQVDGSSEPVRRIVFQPELVIRASAP